MTGAPVLKKHLTAAPADVDRIEQLTPQRRKGGEYARRKKSLKLTENKSLAARCGDSSKCGKFTRGLVRHASGESSLVSDRGVERKASPR